MKITEIKNDQVESTDISLHTMVKNQQIKEIVMLLNHKIEVIDDKDQQGFTALHIAVSNGYINLVDLLIKNGAKINITDEFGWTPLHIAASKGHIDIIDLLIKNDAKINITDEFGWTPLHIAASKGHIDVINLLIKNGTNVNYQEHLFDPSPLHLAVEHGNIKNVLFLIKHGSNINVQGERGFTPLHLAISQENMDIGILLLSEGASVNIKDNQKRTPLLLAKQINFEFFQLLEVVRVIDILFASGTDLIEFKGNIQNLDVMEIKQYTTKLLQNRIKNKIHAYEYKSIKEFQNHISEMSICLKSVKSDNVIISIIQKELDKFFIEGSNIFTLKYLALMNVSIKMLKYAEVPEELLDEWQGLPKSLQKLTDVYPIDSSVVISHSSTQLVELTGSIEDFT